MVLHEMLYKKYKIQKIKKEGVRIMVENLQMRHYRLTFIPVLGTHGPLIKMVI